MKFKSIDESDNATPFSLGGGPNPDQGILAGKVAIQGDSSSGDESISSFSSSGSEKGDDSPVHQKKKKTPC